MTSERSIPASVLVPGDIILHVMGMTMIIGRTFAPSYVTEKYIDFLVVKTFPDRAPWVHTITFLSSARVFRVRTTVHSK